MPAWRELQAAFRAALLEDAEGALPGAILDDGLPAGARLSIYRHHVLTTLTDAVRAAFPVVVRLVGDGFFAYAADRFIREQPPAGPCLFEYGGSFPDFLAAFPPCRELAVLPDVARLEWALHAARHADDALPIAPEALGAVAANDAARLVLRLHPSVSLIESPWPVDRIWRANQPDADPRATVDLATGGVALEIRRPADGEPVFQVRPPGTFAFRRALAAGGCLRRAAEAAEAAEPGFDLITALHALLRDGVVVDFAVAPSMED